MPVVINQDQTNLLGMKTTQHGVGMLQEIKVMNLEILRISLSILELMILQT